MTMSAIPARSTETGQTVSGPCPVKGGQAATRSISVVRLCFVQSQSVREALSHLWAQVEAVVTIAPLTVT